MQSHESVQISSFESHSSLDTSHLQPWEPESSNDRQPGMKPTGSEHLAEQSEVKKALSAVHSSEERSQSHSWVASS